MTDKPEKLHRFKHDIHEIKPPARLNFPFYYDAHPLAIVAAAQVQAYLQYQNDWIHNFGLNPGQDGLIIGKMFGVLVVEDPQGVSGFLAAVSGKLGNSNEHEFFVPPVFDSLSQQSIYLQTQPELTRLTSEINQMESSTFLQEAKNKVSEIQRLSANEIVQFKSKIKSNKSMRRQERENASDEERPALLEFLKNRSIDEQLYLRHLQKKWRHELDMALSAVDHLTEAINQAKEIRKQLSSTVQKWLFSNYTFLNANGVSKSLLEIFNLKEDMSPPAGAGECAAPKLFQYAFTHHLKPIALAEFWWGQSPPGEVRTHKQFYPACKPKCGPILGHMLEGLEVDPNPMAMGPDPDKCIKILYQDAHIVVINKPHELLSVPGKIIESSVLTQIRHLFPKADSPFIIHRLDMSTSGLMVLALTKQAHKYIQKQFIKKTINKTYLALLERDISQDFDATGLINLPLRVDLEDRPRQMVCTQYGKYAQTAYEILAHDNGQTRIRFNPLTGRTHQLRVHAAHHTGLNAPIIGDDLYGNRSERLFLHAETLTLRHPFTHEHMTFSAEVPF